MKKKTTTSRYTMAEIDAMIARGDYYYNENPPPAEPLPEGFWKNAVVVEPRDRKCSVHLRIDPDVLRWFRAQGDGHLTRMNAVLRSYYLTHKQQAEAKKVPPSDALPSNANVVDQPGFAEPGSDQEPEGTV